jgi:hypothetical protein
MKTDSDNDSDIPCTYTAQFPVDEWDRPGGLYSLADVPVVRHKTLTREGFLFARNEAATKFHVRDAAENFTRWVPADAVTSVGVAPASSRGVASDAVASRSSVKGKTIHNRYDGSHKGRFGGNNINRRLSLGLTKDLDDFLTARSSATRITKAEIVRKLLRAEIQKILGAGK